MKTTSLLSLAGTSLLALSMCIPSAHASDSIYGALYEAGNLVSTNGDATNNESVLTYYPGEDGFIAITLNSAGAEWWTSNAAGTVWTQSTNNPLDGYNCTGVSRHAITTYHDEVYIGAECTEDNTLIGRIFKLTGKESVELVYTHDTDGSISATYPTAATVADHMYFFFNGGYTEYDGTTFVDVTTAEGQTGAVPLEASVEVDGMLYLPQVNGDVQTFDGSAYETIGDAYLEEAETDVNHNLPSVAVFNGTAYVGNQDFEHGASLFAYDPTDADADGNTWTEVIHFDSSDTIVNKMRVIDDIEGKQYLVVYTANGETGSNIYAVDTSNTVTRVVDSGLGKTDPSHNVEVISTVTRTVQYGMVEKKVMLFSTKNFHDQTKIFVLNLDPDLEINPTAALILSEVAEAGITSAGFHAQTVDSADGETAYGEAFEYKIKKRRVEAHAVYSLWVNGTRVDKAVGKKGEPVILTYDDAATLDADDTFDVEIGVRHSYGRKSGRIRAANIVKGNTMTVVVK